MDTSGPCVTALLGFRRSKMCDIIIFRKWLRSACELEVDSSACSSKTINTFRYFSSLASCFAKIESGSLIGVKATIILIEG